MVPVTSLGEGPVAVFGLGLSGRAAAQALAAGGAKVLAWDDSAERREQAAEEGIALADLKETDWTGVAALILSPGVPLTHPQPHWSVDLARAARVPIIGDTELFERERAARAPGSRLVAITGTNGKSTTTALIAHILDECGVKAAMGGNIGVPILALDDVSADTTYVVEYSSYQIDLTPGLAPDIGVLLNLSPDHLDRHGTFEAYGAIKARLVQAAAAKGMAIIGVDDGPSAGIAERLEKQGGRVLRVSGGEGVERGVFALDGVLNQAAGKSVQPVADLAGVATLRGAHNWQNAAAAYAVARALGVAADQAEAALRSFPGLPHRMEEVARDGATLFINDSKATNADAAARSLACFDDIFWIAGGQAKTGGIDPLAPYFAKIRHAFLIGEAAEMFANTLDGKVPFTISGDVETAVGQAAAAARRAGLPEAAVLLAPACASFDQFENFERRGQAFRDAVERCLS